jgi:cytoskeletal protein CcmA (bactofilin family)
MEEIQLGYDHRLDHHEGGDSMWKKEEAQERPAARSEMSGEQERNAPPRPRGERATIGRSITIRGDVSGDEDLVIEGRVEGSVDLKQHSVTVGPEGDVKADISGRVVTIEGHVEGNLRADEQVILRGSARVEGDISAPRIMLEDGAYFRGGVDMAEGGGRGRVGDAARGLAGKAPESGGMQRSAPESAARLDERASAGAESKSASGESTPAGSGSASSEKGTGAVHRTG